MVVLPFLILGLIKLVFQYFLNPQVWFSYYKHNAEAEHHPPTSRAEVIGGAISQENFRAVLDTFQAVFSAIRPLQTTANMIEPVQEPIPAEFTSEEASSATEPMVTSVSQDNIIETVPPIPKKRKLLTQMSGVELLDDPDRNEDSGTASNESGISNESCDKIKPSASTL